VNGEEEQDKEATVPLPQVSNITGCHVTINRPCKLILILLFIYSYLYILLVLTCCY